MKRGNQKPVVRGGAWLNTGDTARCAFRNWNHPDDRYYALGFRLRCASPKLNTKEDTKMKIDQINWITIPGREIIMMEQTIDVPAFQMMETLVTNEMWNEFVQDDYNNSEWWTDSPGGIHENIPGVWQEPNYPRETVSWYQAKAFCKWLSRKIGRECNLPTEEQWYYAATSGDPANTYPWGEKFDSQKCNVWKSGIRRTTPVKQYPDGRTQQGLYDMTGNVWEWTSSYYE